MALGQTEAGRYLTILFIYKQTKEALILSARKMANKKKNVWQKIIQISYQNLSRSMR